MTPNRAKRRRWAANCDNIIRVDANGDLEIEGDLAHEVYFATSFPTGEMCREFISGLRSSQNYEDVWLPFSVTWRDDLTCILTPAELKDDEDEGPDLLVILPQRGGVR